MEAEVSLIGRLAPNGFPRRHREVDVEVEVIGRAEAEERILDYEVSDDSLERAAGDRAITWIYCTHPWYNCGWPQYRPGSWTKKSEKRY
jgi:hypothetical protein